MTGSIRAGCVLPLLTRRGFLKCGALASLGVELGTPLPCYSGVTASADNTNAATAPFNRKPSPLSQLDRFNYAVSTQTISPAYQFTTKSPLLETAERIHDLGASAIKFNLRPGKDVGNTPETTRSLRDFAALNPVVQMVFQMPFAFYILWAYPLRPEKVAQDDQADEELYELGCYLLKTYSGTGKSFYLGHWEGDWELRGKAGGQEDPSNQAIRQKIGWLNRRQKAVDEAKRNTPHADVDLFCYAEVNRVQDALAGHPAMANAVIPDTAIDFVSYSSYDTTNTRVEDLPRVLDYLESKLPPKPAIKGKRVWIGEYGFPACQFSPAQQDARTRQVIRHALLWGCPFALYWELYNNEVDTDGRQRGFWLIDDKGAKQPAYFTHRAVCEWGRSYVKQEIRKHSHPPSFDDYRNAAVQFLDRLGQ